MDRLAKWLRAFAELRYRVLGLAVIRDIPTERYNELPDWLRQRGWTLVSEYDGFDAWVDFGELRFERDGTRIRLEWDNWTEGSIEGPRTVVKALGQALQMEVETSWRWREYDR